MTVSRLKCFLTTAAVFTLLGPAFAQWTSDKPPVLRPEDYPPQATEDPPDPRPRGEAQGAPQQLGQDNAKRPVTDIDELPPPGASVPVTHAIAAPAPVQVEALGTPEGPPVGLLDGKGSFGEHIWAGSERSRSEELLAHAPPVSADPVLRDLGRRLVLTRAAPPPGQAKRAFITLRIERLLDAGLIQEAGGLAAQASVPNDEDFTRVQATAILYANRAQDACGAATQTRTAAGDVFWLQLRTYCAAAAGDNATADLTRDVLAAQGHGDAAFNSLVDSVLSKKPLPPGAIAQPNAVHVFLLLQAGLPIPIAVARKLGTPANVLVLRDSRNPPRARFEAAERVVTTGSVSATELRLIADAQDLPLGRVANAASDAPNVPYFMGQVLLRRAASIEPRPDDKARLIALALSLGDKAGMLPLTAALQGDVIATLKPAPGTKLYARGFAQSLLLAKRYEVAAIWATDDPVLRAAVALASQDAARLAAAQKDFSVFALSQNAPDADPDHAYKALVLGLADALGIMLPPDAKAAAATVSSQHFEGKRPSAEAMSALEDAVGKPERRGEAVLLLTGLLKANGLRDLAPDVTIAMVRLLITMNETQSARGLALEALAQYSPPSAAASGSQ